LDMICTRSLHDALPILGTRESAESLAAALIDDRTVPQMRADALADLAKHALGCEAKDLPLPKATVVVRMGVEQLKSGVGMGEIRSEEHTSELQSRENLV